MLRCSSSYKPQNVRIPIPPMRTVSRNLKEIDMKKIAIIAALLVAGVSAASAQTAQRYDNYDNLGSYSAPSQNDASQANKIVGGENGGA